MMRPEVIRDMLIRTVSVIKLDNGIVSKDAALVNPALTPTSVTVVSTLLGHPITPEEEEQHGELVDDAIKWFSSYTGDKEFTQTIRDHLLGKVKQSAAIIVWAIPVYEGELARIANLDTLRQKLLEKIDPAVNAQPIDGKVTGRCSLVHTSNSPTGARIYHLVDVDTGRYLKYNAYGSTSVKPDTVYEYSATVRDFGEEYNLKLPVTRLKTPRFKAVKA